MNPHYFPAEAESRSYPDQYIDEVALDLAWRGHRSALVNLTPPERLALLARAHSESWKGSGYHTELADRWGIPFAEVRRAIETLDRQHHREIQKESRRKRRQQELEELMKTLPPMRDIPEAPDYAVTRDGQVWSKRSNRFLHPRKNKAGGLELHVGAGTRGVHMLVLQAYGPPAPAGMVPQHINGDRTDNRIENLRWGHRQCGNGLPILAGENNAGARLDEGRVRQIKAWATYDVSTKDLGEWFGVSPRSIRRILSGESWAHVTD